MAAVPATSINVSGPFTATAILLATSGDTLTYTAGTNQVLSLFNADVSAIVVTIDGSGGTTVVLPDTGGVTASVASGLAISVGAGVRKCVRLDTISAYLQGTVAITAATGAMVSASITY